MKLKILTISAPAIPKPITVDENTAADIMLQTKNAIFYKFKRIFQNYVGLLSHCSNSHINNGLNFRPFSRRYLFKQKEMWKCIIKNASRTQNANVTVKLTKPWQEKRRGKYKQVHITPYTN